MITLPPSAVVGDPVRSQDFNTVLDAIAELQDVVQPSDGADGSDTSSQSGFVAGLLPLMFPEVFVPVRITNVRISGSGTSPATPSTVTYDVVGLAHPGTSATNLTPKYGRDVANDEALVYPATAGMTAIVVRTPKSDGSGKLQGDLMLLPGSEIVARKRCGASGLSATGTGTGTNAASKLTAPVPPVARLGGGEAQIGRAPVPAPASLADVLATLPAEPEGKPVSTDVPIPKFPPDQPATPPTQGTDPPLVAKPKPSAVALDASHATGSTRADVTGPGGGGSDPGTGGGPPA